MTKCLLIFRAGNAELRHLFTGFSIFLMSVTVAPAQTDSSEIHKAPAEKIKKGWTFAGLPIIGFDADMGFQYGAAVQVYDFGDGLSYPEYHHTIYAEVSRYTKGSGVNQLFYDSRYLIPGHVRVTAEISYLTERMLNFYGFNGFEVKYNPAFEDEGSPEYISRAYYRQDRRMLRVMADFQGPILGNKLRWLAGINCFDINTSTVDIDKINKGKDEDKKLPDVPLLYDEYVNWGLIHPDEKNGGTTTYLKLGLIYDTRDNEPAPNNGIWSEVMVLTAPAFLGNKPYSFTKLAISHRQYITLVKNHLVGAYRLAYQATLSGEAPYYIQSYLYNSFVLTTIPDGLGGTRTVRGMLRNRVVGDGVIYGNIELRYKIFSAQLFKQNFYLGMLGFLDGGQVVQDHTVDRSLLPADVDPSIYFDQSKDHLHLSTGLGLRAVLNDNFIVSVDYGFALDPRDGSSGLYFCFGNLF
jgi:hypothetical protein